MLKSLLNKHVIFQGGNGLSRKKAGFNGQMLSGIIEFWFASPQPWGKSVFTSPFQQRVFTSNNLQWIGSNNLQNLNSWAMLTGQTMHQALIFKLFWHYWKQKCNWCISELVIAWHSVWYIDTKNKTDGSALKMSMNPKEIYVLVLSSLVIQGFKSTTISVDICTNGYIILSLICNISVVVDLVAAGGSSKCLFNWEFGGHQTVVEQLLWLSVCLW